MKNLQFVAESLQATSRVLSTRDQPELAAIQEVTVQLLGMAIISGVLPLLVNDVLPPAPAALDPAGFLRPSAALRALDIGVWVGRESGHMAIAKSVADEDEWQELPLLLQNFVGREQLPCHMVVFVSQLSLPGDTQHRHLVEPVFVTMKRESNGLMASKVHLGTSQMRKMDRKEAEGQALVHIEPYMRIVFAALQAIAKGN